MAQKCENILSTHTIKYLMGLKIAIIGTRGIPNQYGGFEQLAEHLSVGLVKKGHAVTVYNSHDHPFQGITFQGVTITKCYDPEKKIGTAGQFIYDWNCIQDARKRNFDVLLFLGYTSSSVWGNFYPKKTVIISNMDGLEWKRTKYSKLVRSFLKYAEKLAVKHSDFFIADSLVIQTYLEKKYILFESRHIAYGATIMNEANESILKQYNLSAKNYFMLIARMEPENNIEMILNGFHNSNSNKKFLVIGNSNNRFGRKMLNKFSTDERIVFVDGIYDAKITNTLKAFCSLYFHGHSVGGTNPSLLEAMASKALIAAHENEFNKEVLNEDGYYFKSADDVQQLIDRTENDNEGKRMIDNNLNKIWNKYNWQNIVDQYEGFILECFDQSKK
jgi:glycosyltransferase involved in cell wall biosynthesis